MSARLSDKGRAFTLVELLVSMAVLSLFMIVLLLLTDSVQKLWRRSSGSTESFASARAAFDVMTRRLSQATLNTYLDYYDSSGSRRPAITSTSTAAEKAAADAFVPASYGRASDLHFRSGLASGILGSGTNSAAHGVFFLAPLGYTDNHANYRDLPNLLNPVAYFVEFADDSAEVPQFLKNGGVPARSRYRLVEVVQPAQEFTGYPALSDTDPGNDNNWISAAGGLKGSVHKHFLAENVIAVVIRPELAEQDTAAAGLSEAWNLTNGYSYNSRAGRTAAKDKMQFAQMPPLIRLVMVSVDERDAARLTNGNTPPAAFDTSDLFVDPDKLEENLATLESRLVAARVQYHVFSSVISLRAAKWSNTN